MVFSKKSCKLAETAQVVLNPQEASGIPECLENIFSFKAYQC